MAFTWENEADAKEVLEELRTDSNTKWALFGYSDATVLKVLAKGSGGLSEFFDRLPEDQVVYAVLGQNVEDQDESGYSHLKFIFITWVGEKCKPMEKAKSSQHRLPLYKYVLNYLQLQAELQALEPSELSDALILEKLRGTRVEKADKPSGASATTTAPAVTQAAPTSTPKRATVIVNNSAPNAFVGTSDLKTEVKFVNAEEANAALIDVRNDSSETDWVLFGHSDTGRDVIRVVGSGSGGLAEMEQHFTDEDVVYGVLGVIVEDEGESDYKTKKYIFISWVGPKVKPLTKARSSQHRVALYKHSKNFLQLHAELQALSKEEISLSLIKAKLCSTF